MVSPWSETGRGFLTFKRDFILLRARRDARFSEADVSGAARFNGPSKVFFGMSARLGVEIFGSTDVPSAGRTRLDTDTLCSTDVVEAGWACATVADIL